MTLEPIYFGLSILTCIFAIITLIMVSQMRELERHYNKPGITAFMVAMLLLLIISVFYVVIYGSYVVPGIFSINVSGTLQQVIDYGLYFVVAVVFLMSAFMLRKQ